MRQRLPPLFQRVVMGIVIAGGVFLLSTLRECPECRHSCVNDGARTPSTRAQSVVCTMPSSTTTATNSHVSVDTVRSLVRVEETNATFYLARKGEKIARWCKSHPGELFVRGVFEEVLRDACDDDACVDLLDIGANYGYYGVWMAAWRRRVIAFDPQPACADAIERALDASSVARDRYTLIRSAVAYPTHSLPVSRSTECVGQFPHSLLSYQRPSRDAASTDELVDAFYSGIIDANVTNALGSSQWTTIRTVDVVALDEITSASRIRLAKIDTEGNELAVLTSLLPLAMDGRLENIVVELSFADWTHLRVPHAHVRALFVAYIVAGAFRMLPLRHGQLRVLSSRDEVVEWFTARERNPRLDDGQVDVWLSATHDERSMLQSLHSNPVVCE